MKKNRKAWRQGAGAILAATSLICSLFVQGDAANRNAISYNQEGWRHIEKEDYKKAILAFRNALRQNPRFRESLIGLGTAYLEVEAYEQAYDLFTSALAIDKRSVPAMVGIGRALTSMGRYRDAIGYFERALKISPENLDARYGIALIYVRMGKYLWAKRAASTILTMNPYHYDALLLMADIKVSENRMSEARKFAEKAIDANSESSRAHTMYGEILLREFLNTEDTDLLDEAKDALSNALAVQPTAYHANRIMGYIALMEKRYDEAVRHFTTAVADLDSGPLLYALGVAQDRAGNLDAALHAFEKARRRDPSDSILFARFEDFLVFRDFKIGHPARVSLYKDEIDLGRKTGQKRLPDQAIYHLRRSILMNPMSIEARELLMDYYRTLDYDNFFISEMKEILRLGGGPDWQEKLALAVHKRRDRLYHREGFSAEDPPRDVPVVLVLGFDPEGRISSHPDAGETIASTLTFALGQFGRMRPIGIRKRTAVTCGLSCGGDHLAKTLDEAEAKINAGEIEPISYVVYGSFIESAGHIAIECRLMDYRKGFIIGEFTLSDSGPDCLPRLALRAASRLYDLIPFSGRVLATKDAGIVTNLGLIDGIAPGEKLVIYKMKSNSLPGDRLKQKIILTVKEADTYVCYAEPPREADMESIDTSDTVFPLKRRRAKLVR